MSRTDDPWADKPDRFDQADRAWRRKWTQKDDEWAESPADETVRPGPGYESQKATPGTVHDAYGDGMRAAGPYLGLGAQIGGSMLVFVGAGVAIDRWLDTSPWGVLVGAALAMIGIVALVVRVAREG